MLKGSNSNRSHPCSSTCCTSSTSVQRPCITAQVTSSDCIVSAATGVTSDPHSPAGWLMTTATWLPRETYSSTCSRACPVMEASPMDSNANRSGAAGAAREADVRGSVRSCCRAAT